MMDIEFLTNFYILMMKFESQKYDHFAETIAAFGVLP